MRTLLKGLTLSALAALVLTATPSAFAAGECLIGEVRYFAGNFAPRGWALANGQLLPISQNTALFSILGTTYGGDGRTTFSLPDLRGRTARGAGQGPGLANLRLGSKSGNETATVNISVQIPGSSGAAHGHDFVRSAKKVTRSRRGRFSARRAPTSGVVAARLAQGNQPSVTIGAAKASGGTPAQTVTSQSTVSTVGPFTALNPIICLQGLFPSRN